MEKWYTSAQYGACIFNETSLLGREGDSDMTDDALQLSWAPSIF